MNQDDQALTRQRFGLRDGQIKSDRAGLPFAKNQWWFLNEEEFGYGDLSQDNVLRIAELLKDDETFVSWNESQGMEARSKFKTPIELNMTARIEVTNKEIRFPQEEEREARRNGI